jgi:hypothetical protein
MALRQFVLFLDQELEKWLIEQKLVEEEDLKEIFQNRGFIPIPLEKKIRTAIALDANQKEVLRYLLNDCNGVPKSELGIRNWTRQLRKGEGPCAGLYYLGLIRLDQSEGLVKPLKAAFNPKVQYLVGYIPAI